VLTPWSQLISDSQRRATTICLSIYLKFYSISFVWFFKPNQLWQNIFDFWKFRFSMPCQSLWYALRWCHWTHWSLWVLARWVRSVYWVKCHDNTHNFENFRCLVVLWRPICAWGMKDWKSRLIVDTNVRWFQWSEGFLEPPSLWVQPQCGQKVKKCSFFANWVYL
jgi:hypothetical protein